MTTSVDSKPCTHKFARVGKIYRSSHILASQGDILAGYIKKCKLCGEEQRDLNDVGKSKWVWANWREWEVYDNAKDTTSA